MQTCYCTGVSSIGVWVWSSSEWMQCCARSKNQWLGEELVHPQLCPCSSRGQPVLICLLGTKQMSMGETWGLKKITVGSKAMESKDLTLSVPRCSLFPSWHEPRGVLNSGSDSIQGCRVSRLGEYFDTVSWILNGWTSMVCLRVPNTLHGAIILNPGRRWIPSAAILPDRGQLLSQ